MTFLFGLGEYVHDRTEIIGPGTRRHAVHEQSIDIIHAQLLAEAFDVGSGHLGRRGPGFRLDEQLIPRNPFERIAQINMGSILVGRIEIGNAFFVKGVLNELTELLVSEADLIGRVVDADRAGAHTDQGSFDAAAPERDLIGAALEFSRIVGRPNRQIGGRQSAYRGRRLA